MKNHPDIPAGPGGDRGERSPQRAARRGWRAPWLILALIACSCGAPQRQLAAKPAAKGERGLASYYASSLEGRPTASGAPYRGSEATCAHRTHRFGTRLRVIATQGGKEVVCTVNDRGPFVKGRVVDLSRSLAERMGMIDAGLLEVVVQPID